MINEKKLHKSFNKFFEERYGTVNEANKETQQRLKEAYLEGIAYAQDIYNELLRKMTNG